jgi:hypothetical protein
MRKTLFVVLVAACLPMSTELAAQPDSAAEIAAIRAEIATLVARLDRLEQGSPASPTPAPAAAAPIVEVPVAPTASDAPTIKFAGDFRYRHESINDDLEGERHRHRLRARFGVTAEVADNVTVGLMLASGDDDPVSANQTLDGGFDRNPIGIERAFFSWDATEDLTFIGGKMANPFFKPGSHHLIYDNDLNPEGLALQYSRGDWFANYAGFWVEERSAADDSILLGGQVGYRGTFDNDMRLTAGVSYYDYRSTQAQTPFWDGSAAGNTLVGGVYANDYNLTELFGELKLTTRNFPLTLYADYVLNSEVSVGDTGFALGGSVGEVSGKGTWRVGYIYQDLEADAVIGTYTDSDWSGGGTGGKGHVVEFNYGFMDRLVFGFRYFLNKREAGTIDERDYNRLQADVVFNY